MRQRTLQQETKTKRNNIVWKTSGSWTHPDSHCVHNNLYSCGFQQAICITSVSTLFKNFCKICLTRSPSTYHIMRAGCAAWQEAAGSHIYLCSWGLSSLLCFSPPRSGNTWSCLFNLQINTFQWCIKQQSACFITWEQLRNTCTIQERVCE